MNHQIDTRVHIRAPPHEVWAKLVTNGKTAKWNPRIRLWKAPEVDQYNVMSVKLFGLWMIGIIHLGVVTHAHELQWSGGIPGLFVGRHYFRLSASERGTDLEQGEAFTGFAVPFLLPLLRRQLTALYEDINATLARDADQGGTPEGR